MPCLAGPLFASNPANSDWANCFRAKLRGPRLALGGKRQVASSCSGELFPMALPESPFPHLVEGNPASPHHVLVFENLQCSDCTAFRHLLAQQLLPKFGQRLHFVFLDFPLPKHNWARPAAAYARWLARYEPAAAAALRLHLLEHQNEVTLERLPHIVQRFAGAASSPGELPSPEVLAEADAAVEADRQFGLEFGITKTPTLLVGKQRFIESFPALELDAALEAFLSPPL